MRRSSPGSAMYFTSAAANGLLLPSPSLATAPAFAAKATSVSDMVGSILARPRPIARLATLHGVGEGVVAAGVKDHEPQAFGAVQRLEHAVERNRFVFNVEVAGEFGIRRHQIVGAVDLDAVPGVVDDRDIGLARGVGEFADGAAQVDDAEIALIVDDVEAGLLEQGSDRICIARRVGEPRDLLIFGDADDEGDALVCLRGARGKANQTSEQDQYGAHP